jgi:hypothetical protein
MAWLDEYSKRIKLTVDNTNVDDALSDFPILVKISNSSGINSTDVTSIFTELGSDANRKKIAVTISDGETQCYVEIERFDYSNLVAWLWVEVPAVSNSATTDLYFYYDSTRDDNTVYVGDTGDTPAKNVWDSNFKAVYHMAQDPNGDVTDAIKDSTSNVNHGTPAGTMLTEDLVDGKIGKAIDFDGTNDHINCGNSSSLQLISNFTCEFLMKAGSLNVYRGPLDKWNSANTAGWGIRFHNDNTIRVAFKKTESDYWGGYWNSALSQDVDYYIAFYYPGDGNTPTLWVNGESKPLTLWISLGGSLDGITDSGESLDIGRGNVFSNTGIHCFDGIEDEVRISNTARSAAWIKTTYYSNWDELVSFGAEEVEAVNYISGYVKEGTTPVNRQVYLHNRDTGALITSTTSSGAGGYFYLETTYSGAHYVVCLDDVAGADYNDLIYGNIYPATTSG